MADEEIDTSALDRTEDEDQKRDEEDMKDEDAKKEDEGQQKDEEDTKKSNKRSFLSSAVTVVKKQKKTVDRENSCPFLLKTFVKQNARFKEEEFRTTDTKSREDKEVHIHTWMDASISEVLDLLKEVEPAAREWGTKATLHFVYPDRTGVTVMKEIASTGVDRLDERTLDELRFAVGDSLAVELWSKRENRENRETRDSRDTRETRDRS
eukprot:TRINITY_DN490_c0_g3_i1.p2 TRINITY_DN490_c0_g3~~TRINITY_DN490_c0_g3_i1.p2  ORF type:complete len:223 (-),score=65.82 TRINITY_DN490_c0_g3_i1:1382-2008(-)